jgi:hypothetical protein
VPPPAPKKSGSSTWIILAVVLGIFVVLPAIGIVACTVLVGRTTSEVVGQIDDAVQEAERADAEAFEEVDCVLDTDAADDAGNVTATVTADNGSSGRSQYSVFIEVIGADDTVLGSGSTFLDSVPPGEARSASTTVFVGVDTGTDLRCSKSRVDRSLAN